MRKERVEFEVNGYRREVFVEPHALLLDVLREELRLTGTKRGCDMGTCGCCTVLVDGVPTLSCLTLVRCVQGSSILTVEGLSKGGHLHPIQECLAEEGGSQCGFCTPGFLITAYALLQTNPSPTREEIQEAISGNLCRCTGYAKILDAIERASRELRSSLEVGR